MFNFNVYLSFDLARSCVSLPAVMRPTHVLALAGVSLSLLSTAQADIETSIGAGYTSDYVFRGANNGADLFDASIGVSGSGTSFDWAAGLWLASFDGGNELDIFASASKSLSDNLDLSVGVTSYSYFGGLTDANDLEPYISLGTALGGIDLSVGAYYDESGNYDHDIYWEITAGYSMEVSGNMTLGLTGVLGHFDDGPRDTYYGVTAGLSIAASDSITVTPHVTHIIDGADGDETFAGVKVGFGF